MLLLLLLRPIPLVRTTPVLLPTNQPTNTQASKVPVDSSSVQEMIVMMDLDQDGVISFKEFERFFM